MAARLQTKVVLGWVAANVRQLRLARGLTQERLAEVAGLDLSYVQRVERAETNPTTGVLVEFANALEVAPDVLLLPAKMAPIRRGRPPKVKDGSS
jgi:transcriptional regulator with XRE-family HTH domain